MFFNRRLSRSKTMSFGVNKGFVPKLRLLHDAGLREAIKKGHIRITPMPQDDQFQPASLDVRIGRVRVYESAQPTELNPHPKGKLLKTYEGKEGERIIVPEHGVAEIFFHENIEYDDVDIVGYPRYELTFEPRSSRGRLHLEPERAIREEEGKRYVSLRNESKNDVVLYGQKPFAQVFFHPRTGEKDSDGAVVTDPVEAKDLAGKVLEGEFEMDGVAIQFKPQRSALKLKAVGTIDTQQKYDEAELYDRVDLPQPMNPDDRYVVTLTPEVNLPPDVGIRLLPGSPFDLGLSKVDRRSVSAGWADPGYRGALTAHPIRRRENTTLDPDKPIAYGVLYKYKTPVSRPYGSKALKSRYQGSKGSGSRD
jgi:deoxycytidine triphosphate deaminase